MKKPLFAVLSLILMMTLNINAISKKEDKDWWQNVICYEIYIRSFNDSNGDGLGDIKGIIEKLRYFKDLGVDVIWITPFYPSPDVDMGYDIKDYENVDSKFGTLRDFDELLTKAHEKGIKIMVDMVFSHTSDQHPWFLSAKTSKSSPYHNYYVFEPPKAGAMPNNWGSWFSGPAWEYNKDTNEYYLHIFAKQQPALNWKNPKVRKEFQKIAKFWLDKGIDGIRFDAITLNALPDINQSSDLWGKMPLAKAYLNELNEKILSKYNIITVGEMPGVDDKNAYEFVGKGGALKTLFQLDIMSLGNDGDKFKPTSYNLIDFKKIYQKWYVGLYDKGWNSVVLGNHDQPRAVSRWGDDKEYWKESAKMLATFLLSQWGIPYIYQGDEIGMTNCQFSKNEFKDIEAINYYNAQIAIGEKESDFMAGLVARCRDNARTPMQWNYSANAGFSTGNKTWLKVNPNYTSINVEAEKKDSDSILNYYKKMIALKKSTTALIYGTFKQIDPDNTKVFAYTRTYKKKEFLIICNFTNSMVNFNTKVKNLTNKKIVIHNYNNVPIVKEGTITLKPYEAIIYKIKL